MTQSKDVIKLTWIKTNSLVFATQHPIGPLRAMRFLVTCGLKPIKTKLILKRHVFKIRSDMSHDTSFLDK